MGALRYDGTNVELEDRLLTHLQIVIVQKFRRNEAFLMSWLQDGLDAGRTSLWLSPTVPVYFKFYGSRVPAVDDAWLQRLASSAASSTGLILADEEGRPVRVPSERTGHSRLRAS